MWRSSAKWFVRQITHDAKHGGPWARVAEATARPNALWVLIVEEAQALERLTRSRTAPARAVGRGWIIWAAR